MRIDRLDIYHCAWPLRQPWQSAAGTITRVETVLVEARAGELTAIVESCPHGAPIYLPETAATTALMVERLFGPLIVGEPIDSAGAIAERFAPYRGHSFAKAAVEMAWWALEAERRELPLYQLLGGSDAPVPVGEAVGISPPSEAIVARVGKALSEGYARIKLKMAPGWDLPMLRAVRHAYPHAPLQVDCNGAYTLADLPLFEAVDELGLLLIEQPLHWRDLADHATLQAKLKTPICLDESITCEADAEAAIRHGACRAICLKPGRVGGFGPSLAIRDRCVAAGIDLWTGSMLESGIGARQNLALASIPGMTMPMAHPADSRYYDFVMIEPALEIAARGAMVPARHRPISALVNQPLRETFTLAKASVRR